MPARITIERILRDDDDASGQTVRDWKIESVAGTVTIRLKHGNGFILLKSADVEIFAGDLRRAAEVAASLKKEVQ